MDCGCGKGARGREREICEETVYCSPAWECGKGSLVKISHGCRTICGKGKCLMLFHLDQEESKMSLLSIDRS